MNTKTDRLTPVLATSRALPRAGWKLSGALMVTAVCGGLFPIAQMTAVGVVVGSVPSAVREGMGSTAAHRALVMVGALGVLYLAVQIVPSIQSSLSRTIGLRLERYVVVSVMRAGVTPSGINHLAAEPFTTASATARELRSGTFGPSDAVNSLAQLIAGRLQGMAAALVLALFHWWAPLVLLLTFLPWDAFFRSEHQAVARAWAGRTTEQRRAEYFRTLAFDPVAAKEARVFGLSGFLLDRFARHFRASMAESWQERRTSIRRFLPRVLLVVLGYLLVYSAVGYDLASGAVSLTAATVFVQVSGQIWRIVPSFNDLSRIAIGAASLNATEKLKITAKMPDVPARSARPQSLRGPIRFEGVSFHYPEQDRLVLDRLDLIVEEGQSLAIVGDNGAGKTTLISLLAGLYQPNSGRITVSGTDLRNLDQDSWRQRLAVVFQDFIHYPLSARDNIAIGAAVPHGDDTLWEIARTAGIEDTLAAMPQGLDTVLSRDFTGGIDLSGGQWQRLALARALATAHTGADVLILDEPTANLDVRAEAELFDRFLDSTKGMTTVLVSHRFGNVRRAGRIVVLEGGRITEDGTHGELISADGHYARMFRLQAARFATTNTTGTDDV